MLPNGQMPLSSLQLIMQLAKGNPQVAAQMMASTGAQPPAIQGGPMAGAPAMPAPMGAMNAQPPAPAVPPAPPGGGLAEALAGQVQPTVGPGPQAPQAPGAPGVQSPGPMPDMSKLMQTIMAMQQRPTNQMSLGQAIQGPR